jgi:hypothetical protein
VLVQVAERYEPHMNAARAVGLQGHVDVAVVHAFHVPGWFARR